jgi:penicillin-binding protein 1A
MTTTVDRSRRMTAGPTGPRLPKLPKDSRSNHRRFFKRALVGTGIMVFALLAVGIAGFYYAWASIELPPDTKLAQNTTITDSSGKTIGMFNAGENRLPVKLDTVPKVVQDAVLATEDHNYFTHGGVDVRGTARALWSDVRGNNLQGGSTITQQYVKNAYVGDQRTLVRKVKEAILAMKLEKKMSKDEILERYLNTIYFGRGAYGIQTASKAYFNKNVDQLGLQEASYLGGLIRAPELADAYRSPDTATSRRALTLGSMVKYGLTSQADADKVLAKPLSSYVVKQSKQSTKLAGVDDGSQYFVDYVKQTLVERFGEQVVETGGLKVTTTLDLKAQSQAYDAVYGLLKPNEPAGALVQLDENGYIRAMVGGRNYATSQVNLALGGEGGGSGRQAGSTFKPIALAAALEQGICYKEAFSGPAKMDLPDGSKTWHVSNFSNEGFGKINLTEATVHSVNTVYAQLAQEVGAANIVSEAHQLGVKAELPSTDSLALGSGDVSALDMADAYLTFSQGGVQVDPTPILEVKGADGSTMKLDKPKRTRVMSEETANRINTILQQVVQRGTGTKAQIGKPVAGKTGTTDDNGDAWFVGYTPKKTTAVWMGYPEGSSHTMDNVRGIAVTGGTFPAQIFSRYMKQATSGDKAQGWDDAKSCTPEHDTTTTTAVDDTTTTTTTDDGSDVTSTTSVGLLDLGRTADSKADRGEGRGTTTSSTSTTTRQSAITVPRVTIPAPTTD